MDIFRYFHGVIADAVGEIAARGEIPGNLDLSRVSVEPPRDPSHGDIATNAAMVLAKPAGVAPRAIAGKLAAGLDGHEDIASIDVAGPGFINIHVETGFWYRILRAVLDDGPRFGRIPRDSQGAINVEYVSANPTGPMHVGHCRGAVFGDALANLLECAGRTVTREYYINDAGTQIDVLARSVFLRYREALGEDIGEIPNGLYPGDYLKPVGAALAEQHGDSLKGTAERDWLPIVRDTAVDMMMDMIRDDLMALNIRHDVFFSERSLSDPENNRIAGAIDSLRQRGLIYEGRLPPPKGQGYGDGRGYSDDCGGTKTLFKATDFGDDIDRPLIKSDGDYTYFASDIAYHFDKYDRGFRQMINVWGADHSGYIKRMQAAVQAVSGEAADLDVKICQLVRLFRDGEPVKMSKRAGKFITLRDVVDEVGPDAVRFMMLYRKNDAPLDFDFNKVSEQSRDNPVFYVQYAYARIHSVFRNAGEIVNGFAPDGAAFGKARLERLHDEAELTLIKRMAAYPRMLQSAAAAHEPHRVAFYLYELASAFHALWNRGKESPHLRFISSEDMDATMARLALLNAVANVLAGGLAILGVRTVTEMR